MTPAVNVPDFLLEDAYAALLASPVDLVGAPVYLSMAVADMAETHVAIIVEKLERGEEMPRSGNWQCDVHVKVVTCIDDAIPAGYATLREAHRQRCGAVRDTLMVGGLDKLLQAAAAMQSANLTVMGYDFSDIMHRIEGRSWITEFIVHHSQVNALAITA